MFIYKPSEFILSISYTQKFEAIYWIYQVQNCIFSFIIYTTFTLFIYFLKEIKFSFALNIAQPGLIGEYFVYTSHVFHNVINCLISSCSMGYRYNILFFLQCFHSFFFFFKINYREDCTFKAIFVFKIVTYTLQYNK